MKLAIKCIPSFLLKNRLGLPLTFFILLNLSTIYGNSINLYKISWSKITMDSFISNFIKKLSSVVIMLEKKAECQQRFKEQKQIDAQNKGLSMCLFYWITGVSKQICFDLLQTWKHVKTYQPSQILSVVAKHTVYQCFLLIAYTVAACHSLICPTVSSLYHTFIYLWWPTDLFGVMYTLLSVHFIVTVEIVCWIKTNQRRFWSKISLVDQLTKFEECLIFFINLNWPKKKCEHSC